MEMSEAKALTKKLFNEAGLDWTVGETPARSFGFNIRPSRKLIRLSIPNVGRINHIVLTAHVREIIEKVKEQAANPVERKYRYDAVCPEHGVIGGWGRRPRRAGYRCKRCGKIVDIVDTVTGEKIGGHVEEAEVWADAKYPEK